ncbi:HAD family hydrolase [Atopobiaceae bacterium HCP3S3_F7]
MFKLVLSDMDNTLIPIGRSHVSARTLVAIQALRAAGIEFGPCTGRGPVELAPFFLHDADYFQTGVLFNGQMVYVDGELVSESLCAPGDLRRLQEAALAHPGTCLFYYPQETDETNPAYCVGASPEEAAAYGRRYRFTPHVVDEAPEVPYISVTVATRGGAGVVDAVRDAVRDEGLALELVETFPGWCDVLPRGVNKASGIRVLARELGVSPDEVVFFGDAENDLEAIAEVENSVAVANAMPAAARAARWHVGACADDGVAVAMVDIALAAQRGERPAFMREAGRADAGRAVASERQRGGVTQ